MSWTKRLKCSANDCVSTYESDSSTKFFPLPRIVKDPEELERRIQDWSDAVGGFKPNAPKHAFICEYHFPANQFRDRFRTSLNKFATPAFPFGPINPVTNDFCPSSLNPYNTYSDVNCCVPGCMTVGGGGIKLHHFPYNDEKALKIWIQRIYGELKTLSIKDLRTRLVVCHRHFINDATDRTVHKSKPIVHLKSDALPVRLLPFYNGLVNKESSLLHLYESLSVPKNPVPLPSQRRRDNPGINTLKSRFIDTDIDSQTCCDDHKRKLLQYPDATNKKSKVEFGKQGAVSCSNEGLDCNFIAGDESDNCNAESGKTLSSSSPRSLLSRKVWYWSPDDFKLPNKRRSNFRKRRVDKEMATHGTKDETLLLQKAQKKQEKTLLDLCNMDLISNDNGISISEQSCHSLGESSNESLSPDGLSRHYEREITVTSSSLRGNKLQKAKASKSVFRSQLYKILKKLFAANSKDGTSQSNLKKESIKTKLDLVLRDICIENSHSTLSIGDANFFSKCFEGTFQNLKSRETVGITSEGSQIEWSESMKKCAIALNSWSGSVYESLRKVFELPNVGEVRNWSYHNDGSAGFTEKSFSLIFNDVLKSERMVLVCLGVHEIPIERDISWDDHRLHGLVDYGFGNIDRDNVPEATRALIFVATALNRPWTLPLGYCLINNLSPHMKSNLILQYFAKLETVGTKCIAVALDYSPSTYDTLLQLGAVHDPEIPLRGSFPHPTSTDQRVFCFVDTFDLIKSVENLLAEKESLQNAKWDHLANLSKAIHYVKSDSRLSGTSFKRTADEISRLELHLRLDNRKMNKQTARVMKMFKFLRVEGYQNSLATVQFVEQVSNVFVTFTSFHPFNEVKLSTEDVTTTLNKLTTSLSYFQSLEFNRMTSTRRLPLVMLYFNLNSLKELVKRIVLYKFDTKFIYTERLSLSQGRKLIAKLTSDRLLSALEFKRAYGHFIKSASISPSDQICRSHTATPMNIDTTSNSFCQSFSFQLFPFTSQCGDFIGYLSKSVIDQYLTSSKCPECHWIVVKHRENYTEGYYEQGNIFRSVLKIFRRAELILYEMDEIFENSYNSQLNVLVNKILNSLKCDKGFLSESHLFNSAAFGDQTHFTVLVKDLLSIFLKLRLKFADRQTQVAINERLFCS